MSHQVDDYFKQSYNEPKMGIFDEDNDEDLLQEKLKEENYYKYHENVQEYDPRGQPYSYFYITVMGQIEYGEFLDMDGLSVKYNFVSGEDWNVADGNISGAGQYSFKGLGKI